MICAAGAGLHCTKCTAWARSSAKHNPRWTAAGVHGIGRWRLVRLSQKSRSTLSRRHNSMGKRIILPYDVGAIIYLSTERRLQCRYFEQGKGGVGTFRGMQCVREELGETVIMTCNLSSNPSRSAISLQVSSGLFWCYPRSREWANDKEPWHSSQFIRVGFEMRWHPV